MQRRGSRKQKDGEVSFIVYNYSSVLESPTEPRITYVYPPSPTSPHSDPDSPRSHRPASLSQRLRNLQNELLSLETELADPTNPLLEKEREEDNVDPGELIRGLVDVRGRLDKIRKGKEGRGKLVSIVMGNGITREPSPLPESDGGRADETKAGADVEAKGNVQALVEMDHRMGQLEKIVGSSTTALDEVRYIPVAFV
jgi:nuclear migration protein JNM1